MEIKIGNIFESNMHTLVNTVNCVGVMGKGIALEFKKRFPEMFEDYKTKCLKGFVKPGLPYYYQDLFGTSIINFPTKDHWRSPSKLEYIINGLDFLLKNYRDWHINSIALPPLGCGSGGLDWDTVGPIMYHSLKNLDIPIEIYAPYGTPLKKLEISFFESNPQLIGNSINQHRDKKITPELISILEVLYSLEKQPYANPVGRTIFQKICYTLTEVGINTGLKFEQGSYGPFSSQVQRVISTFANNNLIIETQFGKMTAIKIGPEYESFRKLYINDLSPFVKKINKTVDLFSRIKNTQQAEEVVTVFYSVQKLKQEKISITEQEVFDFILSWKKHWNTEDKKQSIAESIRNLVMLNWIKIEFSESLPIGEI